MRPRSELVASLRDAMETLAGDARLCRSMGAAACRRVRDEFTWDVKADRLVAMYRDILGR
jgi:glycosyltransferase involved in cell wall biosynthesis